MNQPNRRALFKSAGSVLLGAGILSKTERPAEAQRAAANRALQTAAKAEDCNCTQAADGSPLDTGTSELRAAIERYGTDLRDLNRVYALPGSPVRQTKLEGFYKEQLRLLDGMRFDVLSQAGKVDYLLLRERLLREQRQLAREASADAEVRR